MLCRITGKVCTAWSETAGCGLVRCKFVEDKGGDDGMTDRRKDCPMRHENGNCTVAGGFCTAVNNPICEALHNAFDCGYRSVLRQQEQSGKNLLRSVQVIKYTCGAGTPEEAETNCTYFIRGECTASFCEYRRKKQTNADLIRAMSDEELAKLLLHGCRGSNCEDQPQNEFGIVNCFQCRLNWLQQPAGEEET